MNEKSATQRLAELATRQYGVVSSSQLETIGISQHRASREAMAGRLHRLYQGVYAVGHLAPNVHGRLFGAVLACGPGALLSHESAAWLYGISIRQPTTPEVTTTHTVRHSRQEIRVHSAKAIAPADRAEPEGIPATAVPRLLLNLAADNEANLRWALPRAKSLGLLDLIAIDELLRRSAGQRGVRRLRRQLERFRLPVFTRSDLELRFLELVRAYGLPQPSMNFFVAGFELDAYWAELRFGANWIPTTTTATRSASRRTVSATRS